MFLIFYSGFGYLHDCGIKLANGVFSFEFQNKKFS